MNEISYDKRKAVYEKAIYRWGNEAQALMLIEEMSALAVEICKGFRGMIDRDATAYKIADATVMLEQLRIILGNNDQVCKCMDRKILRMADRLGMDPDSLTD